MSLKSIEMQIALPRTIEAGKIQESLQQRGQTMNDIASQQISKEDIQKRTTVLKNEQKANVSLSQEKRDQQGKTKNKSNKKLITKDTEEKNEYHPYKGNVIDYSG